MSDGPRACKICQGGFSQLFRGQNIKQRVLNTFEVQVIEKICGVDAVISKFPISSLSDQHRR